VSDVLTVREVADLLRMHPETVREKARKGLLPAVKLGGSTSPYRFRRSSIERLLERSESKVSRRIAG
jgi:excisionase family DNA binding protein